MKSKTSKGFLCGVKVEATPETVKERDRVYNIREDVIRHILELRGDFMNK